MSLMTWADSRIKVFTAFDIGMLKLCVAAFVLLIAKYWPAVLSLAWYWYGIVFVLTYVWLMVRLFKKS